VQLHEALFVAYDAHNPCDLVVELHAIMYGGKLRRKIDKVKVPIPHPATGVWQFSTPIGLSILNWNMCEVDRAELEDHFVTIRNNWMPAWFHSKTAGVCFLVGGGVILAGSLLLGIFTLFGLIGTVVGGMLVAEGALEVRAKTRELKHRRQRMDAIQAARIQRFYQPSDAELLDGDQIYLEND